MTNLQEAQQDMKKGYGYGSVGVIVSGIVWLVSSLAVNFYSPQNGIWTLIIGGVLIFPVANLIGKLIGLKGGHDKNNPLAKLTMEGTIWMIMCIPLAFGLSLIKAEWFFQGMLMIIGGRHLTFATVYGTRIYWILGAMLGLAAYILFKLEATAFVSALTGGVIEIILGISIYILYRSEQKKQTAGNY
ncbi:hypothetical protein GON26_08230 [Flavobacterium sp. GA093]|uniref:DUF308 domain-containing protein n=1 Tax=Flavobacterium hydrocarbonoxydans TaxID=2683249 RepID=A0A6I4NTC2_9FLAO|nr:hypothetical protein [Flavobacterium hydrocarbonoxydans]MWB94347.1 hypothetical protein [Flavobacterium hydrocarbonoxydans]